MLKSATYEGKHGTLKVELERIDVLIKSEAEIVNWNDGIDNSGTGFYPLGRFGTQAREFYTDQEGDHTHSVDVAPAVSSEANTSSAMPYLQLLTCVKD